MNGILPYFKIDSVYKIGTCLINSHFFTEAMTYLSQRNWPTGLARRGAGQPRGGPRLPAEGRRVHQGRHRDVDSTTSGRKKWMLSCSGPIRTSFSCTTTAKFYVEPHAHTTGTIARRSRFFSPERHAGIATAGWKCFCLRLFCNLYGILMISRVVLAAI